MIQQHFMLWNSGHLAIVSGPTKREDSKDIVASVEDFKVDLNMF